MSLDVLRARLLFGKGARPLRLRRLRQTGTNVTLEISDRHWLAVRRNGKPGPLGPDFRARARADFSNIAEGFAVVHQNDVPTAGFIFVHTELSVEHSHHRAELDSIPFDKQEHTLAGVELRDLSDVERYFAHSPAEKFQRQPGIRVPF